MKNSLLIFFIFYAIPVFCQSEIIKNKKKYIFSVEANISNGSINHQNSEIFGVVGQWNYWSLKQIEGNRKKDIGIGVPIRYFGTSSTEKLLGQNQSGFSIAAIFRMNIQWNLKKEHTFLFYGVGPEIRNSLRKDNNSIIPMLYQEIGFKISNPDLLFINNDIGFYISIPMSNPHFNDRLFFSGFFVRFSIF